MKPSVAAEQVEARGTGILALTVMVFGLLGSALVGTGLLSHRQVLHDRSPASDTASQWVPPVDQVVILLVDALRPDFAFPAYNPKYARKSRESSDGLTGDGPNRDLVGFSFVQDSLTSTTDMAVGLVLVADAPTTTSQRLKAIVTGGIPAFVEAGGNFNSDLVTEDNIIFQLNRSSTVLGDDTWLSLFTPEDWGQSYVYPSFDVRDLHTVDNGVLQHLDSVLAPFSPSSDDAPSNSVGELSTSAHPKLVLAHFLGVDHAGHRFSARDEHMTSKLIQLNSAIARVAATLEARRRLHGGRTMLLVFGDHGMTESGDHGGAATEETDTFLYARLFASSSTSLKAKDSSLDHDSHEVRNFSAVRNVVERISADRQENCTHLCRFYEREPMPARLEAQQSDFMPGSFQVDLVPTLTFLLGIPIPFSNLGRLLPEVVALSLAERGLSDSELWEALGRAAECNAQQLNRFLERLNITSRVSLDSHTEATSGLVEPFVTKLQLILQQMDRVTGAARKEWTSIQLDRMVGGAALLIFGVLIASPAMMFSASGAPESSDAAMLRPQARTGSKITSFRGFGVIIFLVLAAASLSSILRSTHDAAVTWGLVGTTFVVGVVALLESSSLANRSIRRYLRYLRGLARRFTTPTQNLVSAACAEKGDAVRRTEWLLTSALFGVIFLRYGTVFSNSFIVFEADAVVFALGSVTLLAGGLHFFSTGSTAALKRSSIGLLALRIASQSGLRSRYHGTHIIASASPASQLLEQGLLHLRELLGGASSSTQQVAHSTAHQGMSGIGLSIVLLCFWLNPGVMSWRRMFAVAMSSVAGALALISVVEDTTLLHPLGMVAAGVYFGAKALKPSWAVSRALKIFTVTYAVFWITALAATERHVNRFVLGLLIIGIRQLAATSQLPCVGSIPANSKRDITIPCLLPAASTRLIEAFSLHLCGWIGFFALSQQCVISSINWNAGFVGLADYNMYLSGSLVYLHTFSAFFATPMLWAHFRRQSRRREISSAPSQLNSPRPDKTLSTRTSNLSEWNGSGEGSCKSQHLLTSFLTLAVAQVALMSIAVTLHRRHLMLWAIFCPKFICDVIVMMTSMLAFFVTSQI